MASRKELRRRIGASLAALFPGGPLDVTGVTTIELPYAVGEIAGSWLWHPDGTMHRITRDVAGATEPTRVLTVAPALPNVSDTDLEIWKSDWPPTRINDLINSVIGELHGRTYIDNTICLLYTSPSPRDRTRSRMPSSA